MEVQRIHFKKIASTNTWAKKNAASFDPKKCTYITAERQTAGRGRFPGRKWVSKKGNLHMSIFLAIPPDPNLAQILALSAAQVVDLTIKIKWPNDLIANGKKLAGILVETTSLPRFSHKNSSKGVRDGASDLPRGSEKSGVGVVLGIGMNVNTKVSTDQPTISLKEISQKKWDVDKLAQEITEQFLKNWKIGFKDLKGQFEQRLAYKGKKVSCKVGIKILEGTLLGISEKGFLQLQTAEGKVLSIPSGEFQAMKIGGGSYRE